MTDTTIAFLSFLEATKSILIGGTGNGITFPDGTFLSTSSGGGGGGDGGGSTGYTGANEYVVVQLPPYVANFAYDFTVQITHISSGKVNTYGASEVENNQFTVYGPNGRFFWMVNATRGETVVEPLKTDVDVRGDGPYRWIHFSLQ